MEKQPTNYNISTVSDRFLLASNEHEDYHDDTYALFQPKILLAIVALRLKHKRPDTFTHPQNDIDSWY